MPTFSPFAVLFRFSFYPLFESYLFVFGVVGVLGLLFLTFRPQGERLPGWGRQILLLLRFLTLLLFLFALLKPTLVYTETRRLASTLHILLDQSESMSRPDEIGGNTRFFVAKESLLSAQPELKKLQNRAEVNVSTFDASVRPLTLNGGFVEGIPEQPTGKETAIGASLDAVRERNAGKRLLGVVLLTDGTQRTRPPRDVQPQDAAARYRDAGIPIYAVRLGQPSGTAEIQDVAVIDMQANDRVFVKNELVVSGSIRISGYVDQPIPVQLLFEDSAGTMNQVAETTLRAKEDGQLVPFRLTFAPQQTGYYKYSVLVPPQPKELVDSNNSQSNFVRVVDGGLNVLFLKGNYRFEQGPLIDSLDASTDIHVNYLPIRIGRIAVGDAKGGGASIQSRLEAATKDRPSWVEEYFAPNKYNVYILDDLDAKAFKPEELQALADRVRDGAGLIMLGGLHAFGAGGYGDTPLAAVSPVELRAVDRQPLDGPIRQDIHWPGSIQMLPTSPNYVLRLTSQPTKNMEIWRALPPLDGANRFGNLKGGAIVLAKGQQDQPLLVSQIFGLGRVLAFAGDSTYRWRLGGFIEEHKKFWRQVVLWLAKMEDVAAGDCWISVDNVRLLPGETAKFHVFMQGTEGEEIKGIRAEASVVKPDNSEEKIPLVDEAGTPTGSFRSTNVPGDYTIKVDAIQDPAPPDAQHRQATARFLVVDRNLELDNPVAYPRLLDNLAATTNGKAIAPEQLASLLDELAKKTDEFVEKRETKQSLYDSWGLFVPLIVLMAFEWLLRKRWGLV